MKRKWSYGLLSLSLEDLLLPWRLVWTWEASKGIRLTQPFSLGFILSLKKAKLQSMWHTLHLCKLHELITKRASPRHMHAQTSTKPPWTQSTSGSQPTQRLTTHWYNMLVPRKRLWTQTLQTLSLFRNKQASKTNRFQWYWQSWGYV